MEFKGSPIVYAIKFYLLILLFSGCAAKQKVTVVYVPAGVDSTIAFVADSLAKDMFVNWKDEELAQRLDEIFHFSPLDYLSRIIFVATPHRGSGYASSILGSLVSKLVDSPDFLQRELDWLIERRPEWVACRSSRLAELGDSVLDLEYDSVTIRVFQSLTWDPRIAIHTILGTTIADQIVPDTTDGIVDYSSGHLDQAISERIVPTGHAVHKHPLAIQEIRRILRKHATP